LTSADVRLLASLTACLGLWLGAQASNAQAPTRTVAQFTTGDIRFTQGGKSYSAQLSAGRIDVVDELSGEAPIEVRTLYLRFSFLQGGAGARPDATPDIAIVLKNADGPGTYGVSDLLVFTVQTSGGGLSVYQADRGGCTFVMTRLARTGVEGTARCEGTMGGAGGGQGQLVTEVVFSARP